MSAPSPTATDATISRRSRRSATETPRPTSSAAMRIGRPIARATRVRRDDRQHERGHDRDRGEPEREDHPALGRRGAQPRLHDDREGQLAGEGGDEHGDGDEALLVDGEEARRDRDGRGGDDRERDAAEQRDEAEGRAPHAQRARHGLAHRVTAVVGPPSRSPSIPSARPRKTHQPSPIAFAARCRRPKASPPNRNAKRHHQGYGCRTTTRPIPRPYARSLRRRSALDRPLGSAMPADGDVMRQPAEAVGQVGTPLEQPQQQVGGLAGLPRGRRARAEVGIEPAELVEERAAHEQAHLDDVPRVPAVERRAAVGQLELGAVLVDHGEGAGGDVGCRGADRVEAAVGEPRRVVGEVQQPLAGGRAATPAFRPREAPRAEVVTSMRNASSRKRSTRRSTSSNRSCATSTIRSSDRTWAERDRSNRSRGSARPSVDTTRPRFIAPILYDGEAAPLRQDPCPCPPPPKRSSSRSSCRASTRPRRSPSASTRRRATSSAAASSARWSSPTTDRPTAPRRSPAAHGARVVDVPAKGYGSALMGGIEAARGEYVIMGDADDSYDFSELDAVRRAAARGRRARDGQPLRGRHRRGRHAAAAQVPRQPGAVLDRPGALPVADRRLPLRPARLQPRRPSSTCTCRPRAWSSRARSS